MTPFRGKNRLTSPYGWRVLRGLRQWHAGQDIVGDESKQVRAIWAGRCEVAKGWNGGRGNLVRLYYSANLRVICQHLDSISVRAGQVVRQGDVLGIMGNSGDSLGAHLHIEVQKLSGGAWVAIAPAAYTEVQNLAGSHAGNDRVDGTPDDSPIKTPAGLVVLEVGPMTAGDKGCIENLAISLALGCIAKAVSGNKTTLLVGPMSSGDVRAAQDVAAKLRLSCKVWAGDVTLIVGPQSEGDRRTMEKRAQELGLTVKTQDVGRGLFTQTIGPMGPAEKQVIEALAASLCLPVGVA